MISFLDECKMQMEKKIKHDDIYKYYLFIFWNNICGGRSFFLIARTIFK